VVISLSFRISGHISSCMPLRYVGNLSGDNTIRVSGSISEAPLSEMSGIYPEVFSPACWKYVWRDPSPYSRKCSQRHALPNVRICARKHSSLHFRKCVRKHSSPYCRKYVPEVPYPFFREQVGHTSPRHREISWRHAPGTSFSEMSERCPMISLSVFSDILSETYRSISGYTSEISEWCPEIFLSVVSEICPDTPH
jgi:hypothetical protein